MVRTSNKNMAVDNSQISVQVCYSVSMNKSDLVKEILENKRNELIWSLSLQEYTQEDIAYILRGVDRSSISRIIAKRPSGYKSPWVKRS